MIPPVIDGVTVRPLRQIPDERGMVMHMLRADDPHFDAFGEIYFSVVELGAIKAWHLHERMTINYAVPYGKIKLVVYDDRDGSPTRGQLDEIYVGEAQLRARDRAAASCGTGSRESASTARSSRTAQRSRTIPTRSCGSIPSPSEIPYDWSLKHG